jgi:hypothetical protein
MHLEPNDIDALLVMSLGEHIVSYRLRKTDQGIFEIVELLAEPKLPPKNKITEDDKEISKKDEREEDIEKSFAMYDSISMPMESLDIQFMGKGMMGYRMSEEDGHDQFAMVNMAERCTVPSQSLKPSMVIKDFKFSRKAWVFPWGFKKTANPTRSVILSRESGLQIKELQHQLHEGEQASDQH